MIEIKPPNNINYDGKTTLFIGGGITGTVSNWQKDFIDRFNDDDVVIFNPRREGYDKYEEGIEYQQIKWEYDHMKAVDIIVMWFPKEAPCVISLHELGRILERINITGVHFVVGIEPGTKERLMLGYKQNYQTLMARLK